ncbi:uncharacterized protein [Choristoneura fumiferana]|uniref:uncharacterized protein n=1 Tax=Choristoneura fumiferana TaxID=7141 RepID=UPI003D154328
MDKTVYFLFLFVIYCCVHFCYGSEAEGNSITINDLLAKSSKKYENTVTLPVYVIYIFGSVLVLLILLVIFLIFVLVKPKFLEICKKNINVSENTETESAQNSRQDASQKSLKRLNLNRSHSFEFNNKSGQYQVLKENDSTNTLKSTKGEFGSLRTPTRTDASGNISPRIIKGLTKDMPIILPEQMSQICKEVLTRTNRNDDTAGSLRNINTIGKQSIIAEENEKKYASSPVLDVYDVIDDNKKTCDVKSSNKKDFDNQIQICSNDVRDMVNSLMEENFTNQTQLQSNNIYDMPNELDILSGKDLGNQTQTHSDDMYDMPKQIINSNKEDFDNTQTLSNNIYDMPKDLDNAQLNYVKPHFPQKTQDEISQIKEYFQKSDYDSPLATHNVKECSIDKIDCALDLNAYDFPTNTKMEAKMYINANCIH